jgi:hypothetical protein
MTEPMQIFAYEVTLYPYVKDFVKQQEGSSLTPLTIQLNYPADFCSLVWNRVISLGHNGIRKAVEFTTTPAGEPSWRWADNDPHIRDITNFLSLRTPDGKTVVG